MFNIDALSRALGSIKTEKDVPMKRLTTFRVGGAADLVAYPADEAAVLCAVNACNEQGVSYYILGNGSNILVRDEGIRGAVIVLAGGDITQSGGTLCADAGVSLTTLSREAAARGLMGLEWACGIPGTVGGACAMNAGAYGGDMKQILTRVRVLENARVFEYTVTENDLGYRTSTLCAPARVVLGATVSLLPDDGGAHERMQEYMARRKEKQPLSAYSAGSTFKRPPGQFAGALIEGAGLKGFSIGGAQVSELHAGFVINTGAATADDILRLIEHIQETVLRVYGVVLECELKLW